MQYVRKVILGQTEEDIARMDKEIMEEIEMGLVRSQEEMDSGGMPPEPEQEMPVEESVKSPSILIEETEINNVDEDYEKLMEQIRAELNK